MRVSAQGGPAEPATVLDSAQEDVGHKWPVFLPDGRHFLYLVSSVRDERRGVYIGSLDEPNARAKPLFRSDPGAVFVPTEEAPHGLLLSAAGGRIEVRAFDPDRLAVVGDTRSIDVNARAASPHHPALLSASLDVLAYSSEPIPCGSRFAQIDRDGSHLQMESQSELGGFPRLSPNGKLLARCKVDTLRSNPDIWADDLERGSTLRLTTSADHDVMPVWAPDGTEMAYRSGALNKPSIGIAAADGSGVKRTVACPKSSCEPSDWSPDGRFLVLTVDDTDVWTMPVAAPEQARPLLAERFTERDARVSPDGRWIAYVSDESGKPEISVRSLTGTARRYVVSSGGGDQPVWRHDGAELFARAEGRLFSASIRQEPSGGLSFDAAVPLDVPPLGERHWGTIYDVSLDGRRVYFPHETGQRAPRELDVVLGWRALIK